MIKNTLICAAIAQEIINPDAGEFFKFDIMQKIEGKEDLRAKLVLERSDITN